LKTELLQQFDKTCYYFSPDNRSNIVLIDKKSEAKTKYEASNPDKKLVAVFKVDGCLIPEKQGESKCDFLFLVFPKQENIKTDAYLIELKGKDLPHALRQILQTYKTLEKQLLLCRVQVRIVISKFRFKGNIVSTPDYVALNRKLGKNAIVWQEHFNDKI
jgi:hypothetical protein